ncbi:hypothetical protein BVC71_03315 [Marivivens niveibacter]|uniref:Uncharacterized protein n=1 Tax=Marivivens niveibacter TaxID=1930667 RepID=A0A251X2D3_9RHOB|nr:hypothetical protein [Marivivens niveibacter]OUD10538.1 hypothetical protein BVC71_03315 [Marivivens niveibacter]
MTANGTDIPRLDHDPTTGAVIGTLIEPARTNMLIHSRASVDTWAVSSATVSQLSLNALGQFDGVLCASNGASFHRLIHPSVELEQGETYCLSLWLRPSTSETYRVTFRTSDGNSTTLSGTFADAKVSTNTAGALEFIDQHRHSDGTLRVRLSFVPSATKLHSIGAGPHSVTAGNDIVILGMQLEKGTVPTSYIPTDGAEHTRPADIATVRGISGVFDLLVTYGDGSTETIPSQVIGDGYWPALSQHCVRSMIAYPA